MTMLLIIPILLAIWPSTHGLASDLFRPPRKHSPFRPRFNESDPEALEMLAERIEIIVTGQIIFSTLNLILYFYISFFYIRLYRENKSTFSLSLAGLSLVLLIYSIASNPWIMNYLWRNERAWLLAFNFIPDIFATAAALILIYLSRT